MRLVFKHKETLQVFRLGNTSNDKIEADKGRKIVQTYTFSRTQFEKDLDGMKGFFSHADTNCLDCPFNEFGKCYTHKFNQYVGFKSMIKSIRNEFPTWDDVPTYDEFIGAVIVSMSAGKFIRFGTYGEPSLHPHELIESMVSASQNWTGYTHQWTKKKELSKFFMASVHTSAEEQNASNEGWRSYVATETKLDEYVNCPASKEAGYKSSCSKCGLCSGTEGKGNKSIYILNH
jgi:hypothetical protein